jgi:hypothetical protein
MNPEKHLPEVLDRFLDLKSFFGGGFECSTFRRRSGLRLDLIAATSHDRFAPADYRRLSRQGLRWAREGVRWHLVEGVPGRYDFSSALPIVRAARATGAQVIWDLCHFGWPEHLDVFKPEFVSGLARYGQAFANWLANEMDEPGYFVPVNEISYFSWAAGDEGSMFPFVTGRGFELKAHLVRAAIETMKAIWDVQPKSRFVHVDPVIHVVNSPRRPEERAAAEAYRQSQFQAFDMLAGRIWPELGGQEKFLEIVGVNFYPHNQWFYNLRGFERIRKFTPLRRTHPLYRPFREMLAEVFQRYHRPMIVSETGAEDRARRGWLRYVGQEAQAAIENGIPLHGICLYPILNHPGWADDRHCHNALWDYPDKEGRRKIYLPLAAEIRQWQKVFEKPEREPNPRPAGGAGARRAAALAPIEER